MNQRRILLVSLATVFGGAEVYLERLAGILAPRAQVFAVCIHPLVARHLRMAGVKVVQVPELFGRRLNRVAKYPLSFVIVIYLIVRRRIQTVHLNGYQSCFLALPTRMFSCLTIITPHRVPIERYKQRWYIWAARWVHYAINVSATADAQHRALLPSIGNVVIQNWILKMPGHQGSRSMTRDRQVLFVGRLVSDKGMPDLFNALKLLQGSIKLLVAGEGPLRAEWESLSATLPVRFVGFCEDVSELYSQVDAVIVPSRGAETSCLVALEAMANGLPCVMSDLPAYREIAMDGEAALLFPVGNSAALAAAIEQVTSDLQFSMELAANAYRMVKAYHNSENASTAILNVFGVQTSRSGDRQLAFQ
jgi:glycosyltransferase involved in cell wall biosynthesis